MITFFVLLGIIFFLGLSALVSGISYGVFSMSRYELRRRAQSGDEAAKKVYPLRELEYELTVTLLLINVFCIAAITMLTSYYMFGLLAVVVATFMVVIIGEVLPMMYLQTNALRMAALLSSPLRYVVVALGPVSRPLSKLIGKKTTEQPSALLSRTDLYELLDKQKISKYSDLSSSEIEILKHALSFSSKQVREVMTPRKVVTMVSASDAVGPILIDELHKSGHSRFPVSDTENPERFVGTLYLHDLVGLKKSGRVSDIMHPEVYYVHEEQQLDHALQTFLNTNHHLLVVVNSFEEFVGVLSIEDVLEQILGKQIVDEFDQHADLRAVAQSLADAEHTRHLKKQA